MIARISENKHLDIDQIIATMWMDDKGVVIIGGCEIIIKDFDTFKRIEDGFLWVRGIAVYDLTDMKSDKYRTKIKRR